MDFGFISTPFFDICLYLPAPLVLVIFDNLSIRKRVSCKSEGLKCGTFPTCFVDFVSSSFLIRFCDLFEAILGSIWHHFWEKNPSENRFKKRGPPAWKWVTIPVSDGSWRRRLACALLTVTIARARIVVRIRTRARIVARIRVKILVWVDCNRKKKKKTERVDVETQFLVIWDALGRGLAN